MSGPNGDPHVALGPAGRDGGDEDGDGFGEEGACGQRGPPCSPEPPCRRICCGSLSGAGLSREAQGRTGLELAQEGQSPAPCSRTWRLRSPLRVSPR